MDIEQRFSAALQTGLLPPCLPTINGVDIAVMFRPAGVAQVGGTECYDDQVRVEPGDTLVLVTDGLVEIHTDHGVTGRSEFEHRLAGCARFAPAEIVDRLAAAANVNDDDVAILALQAT